MRNRELFFPTGDTHTAPIQAMERVLGELPLDGCEVRQSDFTDGLEYIAPPGKAFRITGPELHVSRIKPYWVGSRGEADGTLPRDPLAVDEEDRFETGAIPEHVATVLAVSAHAPGFYENRTASDEDGWTTYLHTTTSDEVEVHVSLRDLPQAWSSIGYRGVAFTQNANPYSKGQPTVFLDAENRYFGYRQATITGAADKVTVELVDIDYDKMNVDGKICSPDGRELQIAGSPVPNEGKLELPFEGSSAVWYDDWRMEVPIAYSLAELPRETRIPILWNGNRDKIVGDNYKRSMSGPYDDDPLRDFDIVYADPTTGKVADIDRLLEIVEETARLSRLSYHEVEQLADEEEKNPNPDMYRRYGRTVLEVIPAQGSLHSAVADYCAEDWELAVGQRGSEPTLFGWFVFPHQISTVREFVAEHSMADVVNKYASADWRIQERIERRETLKPRDTDVYLGAISPRDYNDEF